MSNFEHGVLTGSRNSIFDDEPSNQFQFQFQFQFFTLNLKGGPEPLEKEIHEISGSKREDRFSDPFFDWVQHTSLVRFSYLLRLCNFCKALRDMRKFPQKCQKIAGC